MSTSSHSQTASFTEGWTTENNFLTQNMHEFMLNISSVIVETDV